MKVKTKSDLLAYPPSILFHATTKKKNTSEKDELDNKTNYAKFYVPIDESDTGNNTTEWSLKKYEKGTAEEFIQFRMRVEELYIVLNTPDDNKYNVLQTLLRGEAKQTFNTGYTSAGKAKKSEPMKLKAGYEAMCKHLFTPTESAWRRQRSYMRYHLKFNNMTVNEFKQRLLEMNEYLKFFPVPKGKNGVSTLTEEELVEIMDHAKPVEYQLDILTADYDPYSKSLQEFVEYLERLETKATLRKSLEVKTNDEDSNGDNKRKRKKNKKKNNGEIPTCGRCGKKGHQTKDCWDDPRNSDKRPDGYRTKKKQRSENKNGQLSFSNEQMTFIMQNFKSLNKKGVTKRKVTTDKDNLAEEKHYLQLQNSNNSSDSDSSYIVSHLNKNKRQRTSQPTCEILVEIKDRNADVQVLRCLLDTGTTSSIILREFVNTKKAKMTNVKQTRWKTLGGNFTTNKKANIPFKMPEFTSNKKVKWLFWLLCSRPTRVRK